MTGSYFEWSHGAVEKVQLAGSFTQWKPVEMKKTSDEKWALKLDLPPGEYEFKFVVDGNWVHDELAPVKTNEMGTMNNFLMVKAGRKIMTISNLNNPSFQNVAYFIQESSSMSTTSSIEAIEDEDESWEVISAPPSSPMIEVERKFVVPDNYHDRMIRQGFQLQQEFDEVLVDKYYDNAGHSLIKQDHWLRQRNGDWELKYPVGAGSNDQSSTVYHETTCLEEIVTR